MSVEIEKDTWRRILGIPIMDGDMVRFKHGKVEWFVYNVYLAPSGNRYLFLKSLRSRRIFCLGQDEHSRIRWIRHAK